MKLKFDLEDLDALNCCAEQLLYRSGQQFGTALEKDVMIAGRVKQITKAMELQIEDEYNTSTVNN